MEDKIKELLRAAGDGSYIATHNSPRAHRQVMQIAKGMCEALHEKYCGVWPEFAKTWPSAHNFAKKYWPHFCSEARATLTKILASEANEGLKQTAYDALIKDHSLVETRKNVPQVRMDI